MTCWRHEFPDYDERMAVMSLACQGWLVSGLCTLTLL